MKTFAVVQDADGLVRNLVSVEDLETLFLNLPANCHPVACDDDRLWSGPWRWTEAHGFVSAPDSLPIANLRADAWGRVKVARSKAEAAGCETPLGRVDTDLSSRLKVSGSVQLAMIAQATGQPFSIEWTMQNNSTVTHDAAAMIAMGVAVGEHIAACHEAALIKRGEIDAAVDGAAITAVDVGTGWPA